MSVKVDIIYYSSTGVNYTVAQALQSAAEGVGAAVRLRKVYELTPEEAVASNQGWAAHAQATQHVQEATAEDVVGADAVIFASPTRFGNVAAQLKQFLDTLGPQWAQGQFADRVYSGFVSSATAHGGQESTLLALYNSVHHFGGVLAAPSHTDPSKFVDGNPNGTSHVDAQGANPVGEETLQSAKVQAERVVRIAEKLAA